MSHDNSYQRHGTKRKKTYESTSSNSNNRDSYQGYTNPISYLPQNRGLLNTNSHQESVDSRWGLHQNSYSLNPGGNLGNNYQLSNNVFELPRNNNFNPNRQDNRQNYQQHCQQNSRWNPPANYNSLNVNGNISGNNYQPIHNNRWNTPSNPGLLNATTHRGNTDKRDITGKPNIQWLAVEDDHLKVHPTYTSLPLPESISSIQSYSDLSKFTQDSIQWAKLHIGRLTTSKASGALGIHEHTIAERLSIPRGLQGSRKSQECYHHLLDESLFNTVAGASQMLLDCPTDDRERNKLVDDHRKEMQQLRNKYWLPWRSNSQPWIMEYKGWRDKNNITGCSDDISRVRLRWGGVHEATGLLAVLNYFHKSCGAVLHECGMFPGEALLEKAPLSVADGRHLDALKYLVNIGCLIGASPDGILVHKDGSVEVVEIKSHAPFGYSKAESGITVRDREPDGDLPCMFVPQMQMEMFCVGPHCTSAILLRLTATQGATIMRLKRDDEYIELMLKQFALFYAKYVLTKTPPREDFSSEENNGLLCKEIGRKTKDCGAKAELLVKLRHDEIQRCTPHDIPLLL